MRAAATPRKKCLLRLGAAVRLAAVGSFMEWLLCLGGGAIMSMSPPVRGYGVPGGIRRANRFRVGPKPPASPENRGTAIPGDKGDRAMRGLPCFSKGSSTTSMAICILTAPRKAG